MPVGGGKPERVTFTGSYNISPGAEPGRPRGWPTFPASGGAFKLQVMELRRRQRRARSPTPPPTRSPSFAPNGRLIVYATRAQGREALMTTTLDGKIKARLAGQGGDIREPDWGPFRR